MYLVGIFMKKYSFIFLIILSVFLSSCSAINGFLAESEVRDAKKISHYAPVVYQRPYEETGNTTLVQTYKWCTWRNYNVLSKWKNLFKKKL